MAKKSPDEKIISQAERRRRRKSKHVSSKPDAPNLAMGSPKAYQLGKRDQSSYEDSSDVGKTRTKNYKITAPPIKRTPGLEQTKAKPEVRKHRTDSKQDPTITTRYEGQPGLTTVKKGKDYTQKSDKLIYEGKDKSKGEEVTGQKSTKGKITGRPKTTAQIATQIGYERPDVQTKTKRNIRRDRKTGETKGRSVVKTKEYSAKPVRQVDKREVIKTPTKTLSGAGEKYTRKEDVKTVTGRGKTKTVTKYSREKNKEYIKSPKEGKKPKKNTKNLYKQHNAPSKREVRRSRK